MDAFSPAPFSKVPATRHGPVLHCPGSESCTARSCPASSSLVLFKAIVVGPAGLRRRRFGSRWPGWTNGVGGSRLMLPVGHPAAPFETSLQSTWRSAGSPPAVLCCRRERPGQSASRRRRYSLGNGRPHQRRCQ